MLFKRSLYTSKISTEICVNGKCNVLLLQETKFDTVTRMVYRRDLKSLYHLIRHVSQIITPRYYTRQNFPTYYEEKEEETVVIGSCK
jgi:hypothetical protein